MRPCHFFRRLVGVRGNGRPVSSLFRQCAIKCMLCNKVHVMQYITFEEVHVKRSVILIDRLGSVILSALRMKGQVLHRLRAHLKFPG